MAMNFEQAFERLVGFEGGYVADRRDPGGETKWGISKRAFPDVDIAGLTRAAAAAIYRRSYWDAVQADRLPEALRYAVFDAAVNSGVGQAVRWLQQAPGGVVAGLRGFG
jgi:lysozyme family protein